MRGVVTASDTVGFFWRMVWELINAMDNSRNMIFIYLL